MPEDPNPEIWAADVLEEVIRKPIQVAAPKSTPVKMKIPRILDGFPDPDLKLCEEILSKLPGYAVVLGQGRVQVHLNAPMESSFHGAEAPQRVRQM